MQIQDTPDQIAPVPGITRLAWLVGPAFLGVGAWFVYLAPTPEIPMGATPAFDASAIVAHPRAAVMSEPPEIEIGAYEQRCNNCHKLFRSATEKTTGRVQHTEIVFNHGLNDRCYNCHDKDKRERLVLRDGSLIPFTEAPQLCAQCHGTTFHGWERGSHGKTLGSWDRNSPAYRRLTCVECHDPHSPAFPPVQPLPAPHTLRMGPQEREPNRHRPSPLALPFEREEDHGAGSPEGSPVERPAEPREGTDS